MNLPPRDDTFHPVLEAAQVLLKRQAFAEAARLLTNHATALLEQGAAAKLEGFMAEFPADWLDESSDLRYLTGLVRVQQGQLDEALKLLERARFSFSVAGNFTQAVSAGLAIVRLHFRLDNIHTANHYLYDVVRPLIEEGIVTELRLHGEFYRLLSEISPDHGRLADSIVYAQRAFAAYQATQDLSGQYLALIRLAGAHVHLGNYEEAAAKLDAAKTVYEVGNLGLVARSRMLNAAIHLHWYQNRLDEALGFAYEYLKAVDSTPHSNFRVYARVLLGNLRRAAGAYAEADEWYSATRLLTEQIAYQRYRPWIDAQAGWLRVLEGRFEEARLLHHAALQKADLGEAMSYQVGLAVLNLLEGHLSVAERLLTESLTYYMESGDELSTCGLRFYLAQIALQGNQGDVALAHLSQALSWMAQRRIVYFPHWWHPQLVGAVCTFALTSEIYPDVAERIFVFSLGAAGVQALEHLLQGESCEGRVHAHRVLQLMEVRDLDELAHLSDVPAKHVLAGLLQNGKLRRDAFARLQVELTTAATRSKPNATALAVFGLYVHGATREEIARQLTCTVANVRNYVTLIYTHFGLAAKNFTSRDERRRELARLARAKGYID
jgi:tetratricopeptide (TPR) repeat protein